MSSFIWEDPPRPGPGAKTQPDWADELMANPGKWARITDLGGHKTVEALANALKKKSGWVRYTPGRWEAVTRQIGREHRVYVRYFADTQEGGEA